MAEQKEVLLTYEGLKKLEDELEYLKTEKRKEISQKIKVALGFGDLSENSEYDEAKNEQAAVEIRIVQLEKMLKNAKVIDDDDVTTDHVSLGCIVKVLDMDTNDEDEYTIVGSTEADPSNFKISNESPVGAGLIGVGLGEVAEIEIPNGIIHLKVLEIKK